MTAAAAILCLALSRPATAEPLPSAPDTPPAAASSAPTTAPVTAPVTAPATTPATATAALPAPPSQTAPQPGAVDCWLLAPERLERATDRGLCADAFAASPETAALAAPAALPGPAATPARKPRPPARHLRASSRSESHVTRSSAARAGGGNGDFDFFANLRRDFNALTDLIGSGAPPPRNNSGIVPGSHLSHGH
ncbi:hypothetical protein J2850_004897 [Azospirillum picis]|nr:hypothetical protein [Azospirillum picis]